MNTLALIIASIVTAIVCIFLMAMITFVIQSSRHDSSSSTTTTSLSIHGEKSPLQQEGQVYPTPTSLRDDHHQEDDVIPVIENKTIGFFTDPMYYLGIDSTIVVPRQQCCLFSLSLESSGIPDGSYYIKLLFSNTPATSYLDMIPITVNASTFFYSVRAVPFENIQHGWFVEKHDNGFRFYQVHDNVRVYLGLSFDRETVNGYQVSDVYASIDLIITNP